MRAARAVQAGMTARPRAARVLRFAEDRRFPPRPRAAPSIVGRTRELERLARGLIEVPVAVICGLPGIGKSTLLAAHTATWTGPVVELALSSGAALPRLCDALDEWLAAELDDALYAAASPPARDDAARLERLWSRLDAAGALIAIDDLHHLAADARSAVLDTAVHWLRAGRLVATSRERIPVPAGGPDRLQLRLEALDRGDAAQLWERLAALYGPAGELDAAWQRSCGHPALLRQAHVATQHGDDPLVAAVEALEPAPRRLAGALALSDVALPRQVLLRLDPAASAARAVLVARLIAEPAADGALAMASVMRAAVLRALAPAARDALRAELAAALVDGELDAVTTMREVARHLRALGRQTELRAWLAVTGVRLIRAGATAALLDELLREDALDEAARPGASAALVRARVRTALHDACADDAPRPDPQLAAALPIGADYALERALLELAAALFAARHGHERRAARHVAAAVQRAALGGADPRLMPALYDQLRARGERAAAAHALVIDGARHELVDGAVRVPLAAHPVLRRLLYAFAAAPEHVLDHEAIARALWRRESATARRASAIKSNVRRLRDLLLGTRARIVTERAGYRLVLPPGSEIVAPPRG